jgi:hypothetical protein
MHFQILNKWPWHYTEVLIGTELPDDLFPKSRPLFGSGIRMKTGGFVKADFIRDFHYVGDAYEFELGSIAVNRSPEQLDLSGTTTFHVKQSRILT